MSRRQFIAASAALLISPKRSWAQGTPRRIGCFGIYDDAPIFLDAWRSGLRGRGWIEGKNLFVEYGYTQLTNPYRHLPTFRLYSWRWSIPANLCGPFPRAPFGCGPSRRA